MDELDLAVRAFTTSNEDPRAARNPRAARKPEERFPDHVLIFDTETTIDAAQALNFGVWRYCRVDRTDDGIALRCLQEGIFYADDLPARDLAAFAVLQAYARDRTADVVNSLDATQRLLFMSQELFLRSVLYRVGYQQRGAVVAFNFPFDLSRVAWSVGKTRNRRPDKRDAFEGGFSFSVFSYVRDGQRKESRHRPRAVIKAIDSKRALKGFRSPEKHDLEDLIPDGGDGKPDPSFRFRGHLLDLRTLVFALTDRSHSLESASVAFGVPYTKRDVEHGVVSAEYVSYCREDVEASQHLTEAAVSEFLRHPIDLQATRAYSPATIGKGYLKAAGIGPITQRQQFDPVLLGRCMSAYYGGRAECRIRRSPVPVAYVDFKSMYPTVCALLGVGDLLTSRLEIVEGAEEVRAMLASVTADACFDPAVWKDWIGFAQIQPDDDVLPIRARYGPGLTFGIGVNHLTSEQALWYAIPDLIASTILTGKAPRILDAFRLVPGDQIAGLQPISLLGNTTVDPATQDFFTTVVEQRTVAKRAGDENTSKGLKTLANATSYGIYAQMTRRELGGHRKDDVTVFGYRDEPFTRQIGAPEEAGEYTFPPIAAAITAGARLLLALTEHEITRRGGTYTFCDTDSMAIVSTEPGGLVSCPGGDRAAVDGAEAVRALSHAEVEEIRERFTSLNPYDPAVAPGSILELEDENFDADGARRQLWCYAISAKRYAFYIRVDDSANEIVKASEHGLGHLRNPADPDTDDVDWITQVWHQEIRRLHGCNAEEPAWLDRPAVGRLSISSPHLHDLMRAHNEGRDYPKQVKPFGFLNLAFVHPIERPASEQNMVLVAPYTSADRWLTEPWINRYTGNAYTLTVKPSGGIERTGVVTAKTYRDVLAEYATHPEYKSAGPDGIRCGRRTIGLLRRRHITVGTICHIGKEANALDEATAGLFQHPSEIQATYDDLDVLRFEAYVLPNLKKLGVREVARRTGHSLGAVSAVLNGKARARAGARERYVEAAQQMSPGAGDAG